MLRDQMVEPGISRPYCQKSETFYCGARRRAGKTGAARRASSGISDGCLASSGNQYRLVLHDIHGTAVGHIFRVGDRVAFQPRLNQPAVSVLVDRRDRRFDHNDLFRRVVIVVTRFGRILYRRLGEDFVVRRIVKARNISLWVEVSSDRKVDGSL